MRKLSVQIEINGSNIPVGEIVGNDSNDARFTYAESYISDSESRPISISMPLKSKPFDAKSTRIFFEGLLPEGFTRRSVAEWMRVDENDYLEILAGLGNECLGAIRILDDKSEERESAYRKLSDEEVMNLAKEGAMESAQLVTKSHLSLTGASGKVGLFYNEKDKEWYLPIGDAASTHIVKQSHVRLKNIVANEQLCLLTAKNLGIEIPESFIVRVGGNEDVLFATKRYDRKTNLKSRIISGFQVPYRLHQEDFSQALGIAAASKYEKNQEGYLKKMFDILKNYSAQPLVDQAKLWDICIFNFLIGNTDNHIKNLSLLYSEDLKSIRLAPAYDIISTMVYDSSTEMMAVSIDGRYSIDEISRGSFEKEASSVGLGSKFAMKRFDSMVSGFLPAVEQAKVELEKQKFDCVGKICDQILKKAGIKQFI